MSLRSRQFTKEIKLQVVHKVQAGKSLVQAGREHEVQASTISELNTSVHSNIGLNALQCILLQHPD